jgi:hypothetical protein
MKDKITWQKVKLNNDFTNYYPLKNGKKVTENWYIQEHNGQITMTIGSTSFVDRKSIKSCKLIVEAIWKSFIGWQ